MSIGLPLALLLASSSGSALEGAEQPRVGSGAYAMQGQLIAVPPPPLPAASAPPSVGYRDLQAVSEVARHDASPPADLGSSRSGASPAESRAAEARATFEPGAQERAPVLGVQLDAGLPHGLGASLILRPWRALRLFAGGVNNTLSSGLRGGLTLAPFFFPLAPTLSIEAGGLGSADLTSALRWVAGDQLPEGMSATGSYRFASALLGLELGSPSRFVVFVGAGLSYVTASAQASTQTLSAGSTTASLEPGELSFRATLPSVRAGLTLYLY